MSIWDKPGKLSILVIALIILGSGNPEFSDIQAREYYVSSHGSDDNNGTLNSPWLTIGHALTNLSAGDILNLREGTYYEHELEVRINGTISAPITIQSYPGERAFIDGGVPYFRIAPNAEWELVDGDIHLYRSLRTFSKNFIRAWLVDDDVQLIEYESAANLESTNFGPLNGMEPIYVGPGIQLRSDGHIYIRLQNNPNDLFDSSGNSIAPVPFDPNPNNNSIAVFASKYIFLLDGASYINFKDLNLSHANYIMDVRNGSHHITLGGCGLDYSRAGLVMRENIHDWEIYDCEFNNGLPDHVYWTDVKNRILDVSEAYPEFQSVAISGSIPGFQIHHNLFRNTFDAVTVEDGTSNTIITNNVFRQIRDDPINLYRGISNVEVAHNLFWHVMGGISNLSSDRAPGHVYIHHNVIDNSAYQRGGRPGNYREDRWSVWTNGKPFPTHDDGNLTSWWKLYNNTVVSRKSAGYPWSAAGPDKVSGNSQKYVLNNIFYMIDERIIFRNDLQSYGSHYDGNIIYRNAVESLPLFFDFGDGGRYDTLAEFRADSGTNWERQGLELDPGFDTTSINDPTFDLEAIWERYRPTINEVFTPGASYSGRAWPETEGVNYRGALPALKSVVEDIPFSATGDGQIGANSIASILNRIIQAFLAVFN